MNTQTLVLVGGLAFIGVLSVFRSGRKSAQRAGKGVRRVTRMGSAALRSLVTAAVIVGVQWFVITRFPTATAVLAVALCLPALFAGASVARLLAVSEVVQTGKEARR